MINNQKEFEGKKCSWCGYIEHHCGKPYVRACDVHDIAEQIADKALAAQKAELKAKFIGLMQKKFVMSGEVLYAYEELKKQIEML